MRELRGLFKVPHNRAAAIEPLPGIFPGYMAPIVRKAEDGERELTWLSWGFVRLEHGRAPKRVTNSATTRSRARSGGIRFQQRRCLIPASSFCEPKGERPAVWHWFAINDGVGQRPLFAFPGIWRKWNGPLKKTARTSRSRYFRS